MSNGEEVRQTKRLPRKKVNRIDVPMVMVIGFQKLVLSQNITTDTYIVR